MALSTPPPPPDTSNAATSTAPAISRPLIQNPPRPPTSHPFYSPPPRLPSNPNPNYPQLAPRPPHPQDPSQLLYPVASSGRGFLPRPVSLPATRPAQRPPFMYPYLDQSQGNPIFVRPNHLPHVLIGGSAGTGATTGVVKGIPVPSSHQSKVGHPPASISDNNGQKDLRDRAKDDASVIIRDRKVRIHEKASLYALCRSWLRNSYPEETQPQYVDSVKSLPRPLPVAEQDVDTPDKMEKGKEEEDEEKDSQSHEHLSEKELLRRHIKRAKRVRSRLREERLRRITRYKTRLSLLLPPMVDQHFKNESARTN